MTALIMMMLIYKLLPVTNSHHFRPTPASDGDSHLPNDGDNYDDDVINFVSAHRFQLQRLPRCPISH